MQIWRGADGAQEYLRINSVRALSILIPPYYLSSLHSCLNYSCFVVDINTLYWDI
jgi:hypothetical protein